MCVSDGPPSVNVFPRLVLYYVVYCYCCACCLFRALVHAHSVTVTDSLLLIYVIPGLCVDVAFSLESVTIVVIKKLLNKK